MTHSGNPLEENMPPGCKRRQPKVRAANNSLLELIERQKQRKALRTQGAAPQHDGQVHINTFQHSHVVQQGKVSAKTMVSCSSQTCFVQAELRREKSLTEISNLGCNEARVTIQSQVHSTHSTFVGTPRRSRSHEIHPVPSISPQQSRTESGTRIRITGSTNTVRSPQASSSSPGAVTPPRSPRTPLKNGESSPRIPSTKRSPNSNRNTTPSKSPSAPRTPTSCERLTAPTLTPPRLCRSKSDPSPSKPDLPRKSPKRTPPSPRRSRSSDVLEVKPLVNTYHVITERPRIRARRGVPRELQSKSIKEAFMWRNGATSDLVDSPQRKGPVKSVADSAERWDTQQHYGSLNVPSMEKARSEVEGSGHPTPRTPVIYSIPPGSATTNHRQNGGQPSDVPSVFTSCIDSCVENLYDNLSEEYQMPSQQQQQQRTKQQTSKPLVSTAFHPSPPKKPTNKGVAMYVPMASGSRTVTTPPAKPPRVRKYNRSEVLAFMKRKRIERRRLTKSWQAPASTMENLEFRREISEPTATVDNSSRRTLTRFEPIPQSTKLACEVERVARNLANVVAEAKQIDVNSPELDRFARLLNNFDQGVTEILFKCGFDETSLRESVEKYTANNLPVADQLDKAMRQFETLLVKLGLRESRLVTEQISTDASALSLKTPAEATPPRSRTVMLQNSLQGTPRPHPTLRRSAELAVPSKESSPLQVSREDTDVQLDALVKPRLSVEAAVQTESGARDPNFIHEWRDKYLVVGLHSSTPKRPRSRTQEQGSFDNLDMSHISSEAQEEKETSSPHTSDTAVSEIDNSAMVQARQVLRQLEVSEMNIGKAQKVIEDIRQIEKRADVTARDLSEHDGRNRVEDKGKLKVRKYSSREILEESRTRYSHGSNIGTSRSRSALSAIEGDDIVEEAKRVLRELDVSRASSKSNSRSNVSRNLMDSFEKAALVDSKEANAHLERTVNNVPSKSSHEDRKKFAPVALSCLVSNELDFLEDCNDTLLKMSEVSRAQCYAFAKETNLANEFLNKNRHKTSTPLRDDDRADPCPAAPAVNDELVDELRRSLQEAFDQIEQQSREMSLIKKDFVTSKGESPNKVQKSLASPARAVQITTPVRSTKLISESSPRKDSPSVDAGTQEDSSKASDSTRTASEAKSIIYTDEEKSRSASSQTASVTAQKSGDASGGEDHDDLSTSPLAIRHRASEHSRGDQDSESVSQDTRSRSSDTEKTAKSSVSVSTVKTLNSKLETPNVPVRTESNSFSTEKDTADEKGSSLNDTLSKKTSSSASTMSSNKDDRHHRNAKDEEADVQGDVGHPIVAAVVEIVKESPPGMSLPVGISPSVPRTAIVTESSVAGDPLVSALVEYMERGERLWEEHRSEGFRLLKGVAAGLASSTCSATAGSTTTAVASLGSFLLSKMPDQAISVPESKDHRCDVQKLLNLLVKRKVSQDKASKDKVASRSSSSSGQESRSNSSSDESGELLVQASDLKQEDGQTQTKAGGAKGAVEPTAVPVTGTSKRASSNGSAGSSGRSISVGSADLIENADLLRMLVKRNAEITQKEKFVKYLERERQKIERRSEAIKKREAKLMAEMKSALERERESKISFVKDALSMSTKDAESIESSGETKERQSRPGLRPTSVRKPRSRTDSSGSEDIASMSETDASDLEGSRKALRDEQEREIRQLEKLRKVLETPEATRRPGRKEMLLKRIEVLERLLANNRAAVAMLECSATHVMPKIRRPRMAVKEKSERGQESEESDVSVASRDSIASEKIRSVIDSDKDKEKDEKSVKSEKDLSLKAEIASPLLALAADWQQKDKQNVADASEKSDSSIGSIQSGGVLSQRSASEKSYSTPSSEATPVALAKVSTSQTEETAKESGDDSGGQRNGALPDEKASEESKSEIELHSVEIKSSSSSSDSTNTKERKVDAALDRVVQSLKEDTITEVVKATRVESHSAKMVEQLVGEAIGDIFKANATKPAESATSVNVEWLSEGSVDELSPISSLNGTLARIGQQIFVDDASQQVCIRKIPNKPPPPYTPPKASSTADATSHQPKAVSMSPSPGLTSEPRQPEPVVPMTLGELQTEASHAAEYLYAQLASGRTLDEASYEHSHCDGVADMAKLQYGEMLFDVAKETAEKMFRVGRNIQNMFLRPLPPKERQQAFIDALVGAVLAAEKSKTTRPKGIWSYINSRRMDYIDFIMGKEVREEEREWTEYTRCLEQVRDQLVEQVTAHVVDANVTAVLAAL